MQLNIFKVTGFGNGYTGAEFGNARVIFVSYDRRKARSEELFANIVGNEVDVLKTRRRSQEP